jgi:hypothetical protein
MIIVEVMATERKWIGISLRLRLDGDWNGDAGVILVLVCSDIRSTLRAFEARVLAVDPATVIEVRRFSRAVH